MLAAMPAAEAIPASSCPLQHRHGHRGADPPQMDVGADHARRTRTSMSAGSGPCTGSATKRPSAAPAPPRRAMSPSRPSRPGPSYAMRTAPAGSRRSRIDRDLWIAANNYWIIC